jgi:hypothetical protein
MRCIPPLQDLSPEYHTLLAQQQHVGRNSLLYGYVVHAWTTLQHRYLVARQLPSARNQAASTVKLLVSHFHSFTHELWLLRNSHLHGPCSSRTPFKHLHLLAQIAELYDAKPHMLPSDRDMILDEPFETISSLPTNGLKMFYYYTKPLVERSVQQASVFGPNFRRIDDYFSPWIPLALYNVICLDVHPPPPRLPCSSSPCPPCSPVILISFSLVASFWGVTQLLDSELCGPVLSRLADRGRS